MGRSTYDFSDETVVVTGGASGIGRAVARRFGDAGATVIVADIRDEPKDEGESTPTHEVVEDGPGRAMFIQTDVSKPADIEPVVEAAREFGGIDVMVNNAGIYHEASVVETPVDVFDQVMAINVRACFSAVGPPRGTCSPVTTPAVS